MKSKLSRCIIKRLTVLQVLSVEKAERQRQGCQHNSTCRHFHYFVSSCKMVQYLEDIEPSRLWFVRRRHQLPKSATTLHFLGCRWLCFNRRHFIALIINVGINHSITTFRKLSTTPALHHIHTCFIVSFILDINDSNWYRTRTYVHTSPIIITRNMQTGAEPTPETSCIKYIFDSGQFLT